MYNCACSIKASLQASKASCCLVHCQRTFFLVHFFRGCINTTRCRINVLQYPKSPKKVCNCFTVVRTGNHWTVCCTLFGISLICPCQTIHKNCTVVLWPCIFFGLIAKPQSCKCTFSNSIAASISCCASDIINRSSI